MKLLLVLALIVAVSCFSESDYMFAFKQYQTKFNRQYDVNEIAYRYNNFKNTLAYIREHNEKKTFFLSLNELSDLSRDEYLDRLTPMHIEDVPSISPKSVGGYPTPYDWRDHGAVSGVKDQGQCGSCWAFSTCGAIEGCLVVSGGPLQDIAEQEFVDCSTGCYGCNGCWPQNAMVWAIGTKGLCSEASYTYTARDGTCLYTSHTPITTLNSKEGSAKGDEAALGTASSQYGPVSVCIDASHASFQSYSSGVYYEPACSTSYLDHAVLVVGWGVSSGSDYWIVKNSWGTGWGLSGYIWMSRNHDNNCGIASNVYYGTSCSAV